MPRTWFARSSAGDAIVFVRRFDAVGSASSYEVHGYSGDLASEVVPLPLPDGMPEAFASLDDALQYGAVAAGCSLEAFADVTQGRSVEFDLVSALGSCSLSPLRLGMPAEEIEATLGVPEAVICVSKDGVFWFYGSVHLYLDHRRLRQLEVDNGIADFTSLRFANWFLNPRMTLEDVASALDLRGVPYRRVTHYDSPMLETGRRESPLFLFDFFSFRPEAQTLHAMYWLSM